MIRARLAAALFAIAPPLAAQICGPTYVRVACPAGMTSAQCKVWGSPLTLAMADANYSNIAKVCSARIEDFGTDLADGCVLKVDSGVVTCRDPSEVAPGFGVIVPPIGSSPSATVFNDTLTLTCSPGLTCTGGAKSLALSVPSDPAAGTAGLRTLGAGATQAMAGNDARGNDARTPTGAAGGDLGGTYPNPTVDDDGHSHTAATLPAASTTAAGLAEFATDGEAVAGVAVQGSDSRLNDPRAPSGAASGDLAGTYPAPTIAPNAAALGTDTTGNYAAGDAEAGNATGLACADCVALGSETTGNYAGSSSEGGPATAVGGFTASKCARFDPSGNLVAASGDCAAGDTDTTNPGTVTSVAVTVPSWLAAAGSPVTTAGTLAITAATGQTPHQVLGTCGAATTFAPCALVAADLPTSTIFGALGATDRALQISSGAGGQTLQPSAITVSSDSTTARFGAGSETAFKFLFGDNEPGLRLVKSIIGTSAESATYLQVGDGARQAVIGGASGFPVHQVFLSTTAFFSPSQGNQPAASARAVLQADNRDGTTTKTVLRVQGAASQTGNLAEFTNSAGTILAKVDSAGVVTAIPKVPSSASPPFACDAAADGATYKDTTGVGTFCDCINGSGWLNRYPLQAGADCS